MTNLERYKDEFVYMLNKNKITLCSFFEVLNNYDDCDTCPYDVESCEKEGCCNYRKFIDWLLEEHKEPIKLKQWEYDLLKCYQETKDNGEFVNHYTLKEMQYKGHFQDVDYNLTIEEILDNCEVIEE